MRMLSWQPGTTYSGSLRSIKRISCSSSNTSTLRTIGVCACACVRRGGTGRGRRGEGWKEKREEGDKISKVRPYPITTNPNVQTTCVCDTN